MRLLATESADDVPNILMPRFPNLSGRDEWFIGASSLVVVYTLEDSNEMQTVEWSL